MIKHLGIHLGITIGGEHMQYIYIYTITLAGVHQPEEQTSSPQHLLSRHVDAVAQGTSVRSSAQWKRTPL